MRDINRIKPFLKRIEQIWNQNPDLRFGQLILSITKTSEPNPELFYIEDNEFMERISELEKLLERKGQSDS